MMFRTARVFEILIVCLCVLMMATEAQAPQVKKNRAEPILLQSDSHPPPSLIAAALDTLVLAEFDFEGLGVADPQGWTSVDLTRRSEIFWHVDDFAGLGGGTSGALVPISGSKSLWCGARPGAPDPCTYSTFPGYGNNWFQTMKSTTFGTSGDVTIQFDARYNSESGYDYTKVEYKSASDHWNTLADNLWADLPQDSLFSLLIPADSLNDEVTFRIVFQSDGVWSDDDGLFDSDGAVIIDDIRVGDDLGFWEHQDFEAESVGDTATADGHWYAVGPEAYGDFAGLFDGATVLQEDPVTTNLTHLWGFFNGSTYNYSCGGHPEQPVVPFGRSTESGDVYLENMIYSPWISLAPAEATLAAGGKLYLEYDAYLDLPEDNLVYYCWDVRSRVDGCDQPWNFAYLYLFSGKVWRPIIDDITNDLPAGATDIQIGLYATDLCGYWCGIRGSGACHSHGPLFDNVTLRAYSGVDTFYVTNTDTIGSGSLHNAMLLSSAFSTPNTILFDIPGPGPHVIESRYGIRTGRGDIIDGRSQPGYAGTPLIYIEGVYDPGNYQGVRLYHNARIYGIGVRNYENGIVVRGDSTVIDGCEISNISSIYYHGSGITFGSFVGNYGLVQNCEIFGCSGDGIYVTKEVSPLKGNTFRANSIHDNAGLGIDLYNDYNDTSPVALNDPLDADTGANDLQNYPVLDYMVTGSPGAIGGTLTTEPNEECVIDFYANPSCDGSGYGEGEIYLGSTTVTTGAAGSAAFHASLPSVPSGHVVTATATNSRGSTSEFSHCCSATASVFEVTNTSGYSSTTGSLGWAVEQANSDFDVSLIRFNIPGSGPHVIQPRSDYDVVRTTIIDGFTQPGASPNTNPVGDPVNAVIQIEIDCGRYDISRGFIVFDEDMSVIRGLSIYDTSSELIYIHYSSVGTRVEGCYLGLDASGAAVGQSDAGILSEADDCVVGGASPEARNVICGAYHEGIELTDGNNQKIWGNYIGVGIDGVTPMGNERDGIHIGPAANTGTQIGGLLPGQGNIIANNTGNGVTLSQYSWPRLNPILGNSIYNNGELGIDLSDNGITLNDPGDADTGPNDYQNYPVVVSVMTTTSGTNIQGSLNSTLNESFRLEFFSNVSCDPTGYGEGRTYLGSDSVHTDPGPDVGFDITLPVVVPGDVWITATATDLQGNTSEFSQCLEFLNTEEGSDVVTVPPDENGDTPLTLTFDQIDVAGNTMLSTSGTCSGVSGSFNLSDPPVCYDVTTDATFTGNIQVCVQYDENAIAGAEANVRLAHWDDMLLPPDWVDVTISVDTDLNIVCGEVSHLSPFVVGTGSITGIGDRPALPITNALHQNVPNPFNPVTTIHYTIVENSHVRLNIYDVAGRLVRTLVNETQRPDYYEVTWNGVNDSGQMVATGIYFYRITAGKFVQTRKMLLLK
jgi:hypothetical protein